ncbi:unnamed protein product [Ambrosiozyma monospora]|uniref:Unnamed protein product n=1 Tax=Ambrosiozyma monospora TaxID=43982 RepID=A0ACB5TCG7_AMBMO|nr:unnamed protein product [Ambrosiozyma monospora]
MKVLSTLTLSSVFLALAAKAKADTTVTIDDEDYVSYGLKGYGFLPGDAVDVYGDTISFGSSVAYQWNSLKIENGVYSFTAYGLPDRGYNVDGTNDVAARVHVFDVTFTPEDEGSEPNLVWNYKDSILLKDFNGENLTGLDANTTVTQNGREDMPGVTFHVKPSLWLKVT